MIKLIIFDLDGVLVDAKDIHFRALNRALSLVDEKYTISIDDHHNRFDGLKTNQKLDMLTKERGLPENKHELIWSEKQRLTLEEIKQITPSSSLQKTLSKLKEEKYQIACCSNSIRTTVLTVLSKLDIIEFFDLILSNQDVINSKPHPEMYWKAISCLGALPEETLIIEDSPPGLLAACRSRSHILRVLSPAFTTYDDINTKIQEIKAMQTMQTPKWKDNKLNVLIPMAGAGTRFEQAGYNLPKPLIDVRGKPMIQLVIENLNLDANYIFVVQKTHREKYNLDALLSLIAPNCKIIDVDGVTEGAACTALLAKEHINNDYPLFFANSDQFVEWDSNEFMYRMQETNSDGGIVTFKSTHPKWSFVRVDDAGLVTEVSEKNPISDIATVGYYFWKKGKEFVKYAESMISKNIRFNNEFYVCPVFNQAIEDGKKIKTYNCEGMWGLGTPEDLDFYLKNYK